MKLVAVTRILNEDDIVEAFVRHHAIHLDHHLFFDNGSVDRTLEILRALQSEGAPLTVLQGRSAFFNEIDVNTGLLVQAAQTLKADWVMFLDTDEFIDGRRTPAGLRAQVEAKPADLLSFSLPTAQYYDMPSDDAADLLVPSRLRWRPRHTPEPILKVAVRGVVAGHATVDAGQHRVEMNGGATLPSPSDPDLVLAHYYRRGPWHALAKNVVGRLKMLASGEKAAARNFGGHYTGVFEALRDHPESLLRDPAFMAPAYAAMDLVDDPIRYDGGALRYTSAADGPMKAVKVLTHYAEELARHAGTMLDRDDRPSRRNAANWTKLF